jgi:hypothetical protein
LLPAIRPFLSAVPALGPPSRPEAGPSVQAGGARSQQSRSQLLADRAVLQLAWIGLLAVREGFTCPPDISPPDLTPPEPAAETIEADLLPEPSCRGLSAYQRAQGLSGPKMVRVVDTRV